MKKLSFVEAGRLFIRGINNYRAKRPLCVSFEVTLSCNANCRHCDNGGLKEDENRLEPGEYTRLTALLQPPVVQISGGEPLLREDAVEILSIMDVFVLTSLHEGIPLSLLEAMWLGLPVVATEVGGVPEVIEDGRSGLLVGVRDEKAIAAAILEMLSPRAEEIGRGARQRVLEEFSLQKMVESTEEVYRQLFGD